MNELDIGRRGTGKSTLAMCHARRINRHQIYFDPGDQFRSVDERATNVAQFEKLMGREWEHELDSNRITAIAYVPPSSNVEQEWDRFAECLWEYTGTHEDAASYCLVIDEAHELQSSQQINDWLARFIRRAPRRERDDPNPIDMIQTTHNPQDLNRLTFSQADEVYIFNMFDKRALKAIEDQWGPEVVEEVKALRTPKRGGRDVLYVEAETGNFTLMDDPQEWACNIRDPKQPREIDKKIHSNLEDMYGRF